MRFYAAVFTCAFTREIIDGNEMALFRPAERDATTDTESLATSPAAFGMAGALAIGESYLPSKDGVVIYFATRDIADTMQLVRDHGGIIECVGRERGTTFRVLLPMLRNAAAPRDFEGDNT